jgi:N12 class adenine-specific DNA methylase
VLVKYTGWGAFAQKMFAGYDKDFKDERAAFRALVTDEEYRAASASTLNAHYTSPDVVKGMWDALAHLGYDGGLAIEPSCGSGNFIGMIPDGLAERTAWTGVELDPITGRIAKALYGGAEINIQGFETLKRPSNYYDLAISNVPFGKYNLREKPYGAYPIHDFFFVKSLDKVRPGGVVAFITSRFTMDKLDPALRRELAKTSDLVGAIRLPGGNKGAFAGNAGTAVTTDIIFLRKKIPGETPFPGAKWEGVKPIETPEGPAVINEYFADHPDMMLGEMRLTRGMYTENEPTLVGEADGLREKIAAAAQKMQAGALTDRLAPPPPPLEASGLQGNAKEGGFFVEGGKLFRRVEGVGVPHPASAPDTDRITRLVGMRDIVNDLLKTQLDGGDNAAEQAEYLREKLRTAYDAFVKKYGPINKEVRSVTSRLNKQGEPIVTSRTPNLAEFKVDPDAYKVAAIERYDADSDTATRATIQTKDVISPPTTREINSPSDALAAVLDIKGRVDLQSLGEMLGAKTEEEVISRLGDSIYQNPNGRQWETVDQYLSGDVVSKLEDARALAQTEPAYLRNVAALEKVQPTPLEPNEITAQFGAPWVPAEDYATFLKEIGARNPTVRRVPGTAEWKVDADGYSAVAVSKFGADRTNIKDIVDAAMNNRTLTVYDHLPDGNRVVNGPATEQARVKINELKEAFTGDPDAGIDSWVWKDPNRSERLAAIYNRTFNNVVQRKFDGSHQTFPGMSAELSLRPHQSDAVWRTVQNGNTLLAHVVGAGKTFTMIASGMEQRRLGLIKKPMYVVPNHMLEQFSREFLQAYPDAKILVAQKDEMTKDARRAFASKAASNDWDGIVITHDAFGRLNMQREFRANYMREQIDSLERARQAEAAESGAKAPTVKELEKARKVLEGRLEKLLNEDVKDQGTTFEETGADFLYVDEAHKFKNLSFVTRMQRVKGLSQGNSQRAEDLFLKMRYLEEKRPGRSAVFATGTPVSNTMAELWTMMRYLELDKLKAAGLDNFDAWASTFGKVVNNTELSADGRTFKDVSSFSKFVNVPELISLYSEIADTRTADMLNLPRPEVKTESGAPGVEIVQAEPSEQEEAYINELVKLAEAIKGRPPKAGEPNMLSVVGLGRKVATDGRLIDPERFAFNPKGKIALAVSKIAKIYHEGKEPGMAQMVFLDLGVPSNRKAAAKPATLDEDGEIIDPAQEEKPLTNLYADIKERLVAEGIPGHQIAFIHDAGDDEKKAKLFAKVRSGEVRVILGSSEKMGVGTNVQQRLIAMHHLDAPWRPADVEQRDGRIIRQGNMNRTVRIYRYVTKRSFDAFMWQKLDTKSKFIGQVLSGAKGSRSAEDVDNPLPEAAEMKAAASGDPRIMEHADLSRQVRQLQAQKRAFDTTFSRATWELKQAKARVANYEASLPDAKADAELVQDLSGDKFNVKLGGQTYDSRTDAGNKIIGAVMARNANDFFRPVDMKVGEMSGFEMRLEIQKKWVGTDEYLSARASLVGKSKYSGVSEFVINAETPPVGLMNNFTRLLSQIANQTGQIERGLENERKSIATLSQTLQATWPRQEEYATALKKLADLNADMAKPQEKPGAPGGPEILEDKPKEAAEGVREFEQSARAKIRFAEGQRPILTMFRDANASSIVHEFGHDFLEQQRRDAAHPAAPDQVRADYQTLRNWLGIKGTITTKQHERFARTWERYLREGVAPSQQLAGVFAKFKNWLTSIYQSVKSIGEPISDDVRAVFDRMLTTEPQRTVIAPERPAPPSLADIHEADEAEAAPHEKEPIADRVVSEVSRYIAEQPPKVVNELTAALPRPEPTGPGAQPAGETGERAGRADEVVPGGDQSKPKPGSGAGGEERGQELRGGSQALPGGSKAGARPVSGNAAGSQIPAPGPTELLPGPDGRLVDLAGNIRLDNLTDSEDVAQAIREAAERNDDFIGDRRGVITDGQVLDLADALGMDAATLNTRKIGQAFNAEQIIAARKLLIQSATAVAAAMKTAATGSDEDLLNYMLARDRHQMIQAQVAGITAEAGRALRAFRNIKGQEGAMNVNAFIKSATGRTLYQLKEEAKLGSALQTPEQVSKMMADGMKRTFGKMLLEYWINGLISGPVTHTTYIIGNELLALHKAGPETAVAAAIGALRSKFGRTGDRVLPGEVGAQLSGMVKGFAPGVKAATDALRTGATTMLPGEAVNPSTPFQPGDYAPSGELELRTTPQQAVASVFGLFRGMKDGFVAGGELLRAGGVEGAPLLGLHYQPIGYIPDVELKGVTVLPIGTAARLPSRMVAAIHSFFRAMNYSTDIGAEAYRKAAGEGASDIAARVAELRQNPDPEMMARSVQKANELTLMGQGGDFVRGLQKITNIEVVGIPVLKFIDPFVNIAANIMDQSIVQRTPAGLLSQSIRDDLMGKNGNVAADTAAAKMLVGTALSLTFGGLAAAGYASGSGPSDPKQAAMWRLAGNQAHSVRVGNIWYQVNRIGPLGMLMGIAADLQGVAAQAERGQLDQAGAALVHAFSQNILDESFMRGPADLIQAVENSDQYGPQYVRNFLSSFVPYSVGMAQMARAMDPYQRQTRSITDAILAKIPGLSESLFPRRDIWGQPMPNGDALISPGVTAIYETKISTDPVNIALEQLGIAPAPVERRIRAVPLSEQQYDDYARIAGSMTKMRLDVIVNSPDWRVMPPGTKYETINAVIDNCREVARNIMLMKYPQIAVQAARLKMQRLQGPAQ